VGADLSYDFINRPAYHHAFTTGDTEFLRLTLRAALDAGVDPAGLVHAMQNHDELTYELVHWAARHRSDPFFFRGEEITGAELAETVRADMLAKLTGERAPYNLVFTTNGIACTTASVIAAVQGFTTLDAIGDDDIDGICRAQLLLAMFNAWQPGVFALSAWDLLGVLPLPADQVRDLIATGDTRWIHRGAHDLTDANPGASVSSSGMPRGRSLFGSLPAQLRRPDSFASRLKGILRVRAEYCIDVATQIDVPDVAHPGMLVMVHRLDEGDRTREDAREQVTVLNFSDEAIEGTVRSDVLTPRRAVIDVETGDEIGRVDDLNSFSVSLAPYAGLFLVLDDVDDDTA
jgi:trehalose synthase